MFKQNINAIINSNKEVFLFELANEGEIIYTIFDSSLSTLDSKSLYDKNILKYSTLIDENDIIHLVALINTGELNYYKYQKEKWSKLTIAKFDMKSNIYNQIEILMIQNRLHIFYNYSNLINSNIWTIQHVIYGNEEKHNAVRYISRKFPDPFVVDVDSQGTIHLLYRSNINNPQVYHSFYSHYTKSWSSLSKQISSDNTNNLLPFLFIDSQDNLHGLWLEESDSKYQIKYFRMSSSGKAKYIWKDIKLPYIQLPKYPPIIFEENSTLKLIFLSNDKIDFLYSSDYGNSWIKGNSNEVLKESIILIKVKSNINKMNYIYCNSFDNPRFYFLNSFSYKEPIDIYEKTIDEKPYFKVEVKESIPDTIETNSDFLNELEIKFNQILDYYNSIEPILAKTLDNHNSIESILAKILDNQQNLEHKLDDIKNFINSKKTSFINRLFN